MRILSIVFFLFIFGQLFSNKPGFLGRRAIIGYELGLNHPVLQNVYGKLPSFYNSLKFEYVVSRGTAIGFSYMFHIYNNYPVKNNKNRNYIFNSNPELLKDFSGNFNSHLISFYTKFYKSSRYGHIAPNGYYIKPGVGFLISNDKFVSQYLIGNNSSFIKFYKVNVISYFPVLKLGVGRDFVFLKRLVVDFGIDLNLTLPNFADGESYSNYTRTPHLKMAYDNAFFRNLFNVHIGIGFLTF